MDEPNGGTMSRPLDTLTVVPGVDGPAPTTYDEFLPYYVSQHLHPWTRHLHAWGPLVAAVVGIGGAATGRPWALPLAVVVGYGIAWFSHFVIEHNRPASWGRPAWSFRGDMDLIRRYYGGGLGADVAAVRRAVGLQDHELTLADAALRDTAPAQP
jgi:hypothetical protein